VICSRCGRQYPGAARRLIALLVVVVMSGCDGASSAASTGGSEVDDQLDAGVAAALLAEFSGYDGCPTPADRGAPRCLTSRIDLSGDGRAEVLALALGRAACGSGGCTALVLQEGADGYQVITRITTVSAPILAATQRTEGCGVTCSSGSAVVAPRPGRGACASTARVTRPMPRRRRGQPRPARTPGC